MKRARGNLIPAVFTFFFLLLAFEILLRTTRTQISWSTPDPILGWRFPPSREYLSFSENNHAITWKTNSWGWKDKEWSLQKAPGIYRIAVLGDSYVEALQVESNRNFLSLAEAKMRAQGIQTEWMNFGRSGFTQTEEWYVLQKDVLPFKPDLVILFFFPSNDIEDMDKATSTEYLRPFVHLSPEGKWLLDTSFCNSWEFKIKCFLQPFKDRSVLISFLIKRYNHVSRQWYARKVNKRNQNKEGVKKIGGSLSLGTKSPAPHFEKDYDLSKQLIKEMVRLCRSHGIRFMLVTTDTPAYLPEIEERYRKIDETFDPYFFDEDSRKFSNSLSIPYLGLQKPFRETYFKAGLPLHWKVGSPWSYSGQGHWNYSGHEVVAENLAVYLKKLL